MRGPRFALTGPHAHAIQRRRDVLVGPSGRHAAHDRQGFAGRLASMLAGLGLADTELRMLPAAPMDRENHVTGRFIDIGDYIHDESAKSMKPTYYQAVRTSVASGARLAGGAERQPSAAFRTNRRRSWWPPTEAAPPSAPSSRL